MAAPAEEQRPRHLQLQRIAGAPDAAAATGASAWLLEEPVSSASKTSRVIAVAYSPDGQAAVVAEAYSAGGIAPRPRRTIIR
jgi:hypothetical protein